MLILASCARNPMSYYNADEKIIITLEKVPKKSGSKKLLSSSLALAAPELINLGLNGVKSLVTNEQKKYIQSYSKTKRDDNFYQNKPIQKDRIELSYSGFIVDREVKKSKNITNDKASELKFNFIIDSESESMMAIEPASIKINSTKSKLKSKDSNLDIKVDIILKAYWTTKNEGIATFTSSEIANVSFTFKSIELGTLYDSKSDALKNIRSDWFSAVPVTVIDDEIRDFGKFKIEVTVTESDNITERFEKISKKFDASEELLKTLLNNFFKEE